MDGVEECKPLFDLKPPVCPSGYSSGFDESFDSQDDGSKEDFGERSNVETEQPRQPPSMPSTSDIHGEEDYVPAPEDPNRSSLFGVALDDDFVMPRAPSPIRKEEKQRADVAEEGERPASPVVDHSGEGHHASVKSRRILEEEGREKMQ
jgi:hypothetical protein